MEIVFPSKHIEDKLRARAIDLHDILACMRNKEGQYVEETSLKHTTNPATYWFIAEDDKGRMLKIAFIYYSNYGEMHIKSAFEASPKQIQEYEPFKQ